MGGVGSGIRGHKRAGNYYIERNKRLREKFFEMYGHRCSRCGFDDKRALQLDHVNGDGASERERARDASGRRIIKKSSTQIYRKATASYQPGSYRVLCANCNFITRVENGFEGGNNRRRG